MAACSREAEGSGERDREGEALEDWDCWEWVGLGVGCAEALWECVMEEEGEVEGEGESLLTGSAGWARRWP